MPEIPNVVPGEPVESSWGNDIRDRTLQRYASQAARDASIITPASGDTAYLLDLYALTQFDGSQWAPVAPPVARYLVSQAVNTNVTAFIESPPAPADGRYLVDYTFSAHFDTGVSLYSPLTMELRDLNDGVIQQSTYGVFPPTFESFSNSLACQIRRITDMSQNETVKGAAYFTGQNPDGFAYDIVLSVIPIRYT
jgi:hypothetical protein